MAIRYKHLALHGGVDRATDNIERFGWKLYDTGTTEIDHRKTEVEGYYDGSGKFIIEATKEGGEVRLPTRTTGSVEYLHHLYFYRDSRWYKNLPAIIFFELLFNICFLVRRILGWLLKIAGTLLLIGVALMSVIGIKDTVMQFALYVFFAFLAWLFLLILESVLSRIAEAILKEREK